MTIKSYQVSGKVQGVMFRQTFIRCCQRFKITAGATNTKTKTIVTFTIKGDDKIVQDFMKHIESFKQKPINNWGAQYNDIKEITPAIPLEKHQVTTENVDDRKWNPNVKFFL